MSTGSQVHSSLPAAIHILDTNVERCMFARSLSPVDRTNQKGTMSSFSKAVIGSAFGAVAAVNVAVKTASFSRILS